MKMNGNFWQDPLFIPEVIKMPHHKKRSEIAKKSSGTKTDPKCPKSFSQLAIAIAQSL